MSSPSSKRRRMTAGSEPEPEPEPIEQEPKVDLNTAENNEMEEEQEVEEEVVIEDKQEEEKEAKSERDRIHAFLLSKPPYGSEVYISGLPTNATKEELKGFCEASDREVVEVKITMKEVYAYALVSFRTVNMASKAIKELHNSEFKGKKVNCTKSKLNNTIFIRNIPCQWEESDLKNAINQVCPGVISILVVKDSRGCSAGFGFVAYYNHACAKYSLEKMSGFDFKLGTNSPSIEWADSRVKEVYVQNLPMDVTVEQIKELFERHGNIEKVLLHPPKAGHGKQYAFVHFEEHVDGVKALQSTERYELNGEVLDVRLAKAQANKQPQTGATIHRGPPIAMPGYSSWFGYPTHYGFVPPPYLAPAPPGLAMVPMVLPDGHLRCGMQQPAVGPTHNRGNRGGGQGSGVDRRGGNTNPGPKRFRSL